MQMEGGIILKMKTTSWGRCPFMDYITVWLFYDLIPSESTHLPEVMDLHQTPMRFVYLSSQHFLNPNLSPAQNTFLHARRLDSTSEDRWWL
jgi:hypothetical protein